MAKTNSTLEPRLAKAKFPYTRQLTVLESLCESSKSNDAGVHYRLIHIIPCTILKGKWFVRAGFTPGHKMTIQVSENKLVITPDNIASNTEVSEV
ncbi:MAG: SymE family type I addiction module toxin [Pseudomonadales bacterium]